MPRVRSGSRVGAPPPGCAVVAWCRVVAAPGVVWLPLWLRVALWGLEDDVLYGLWSVASHEGVA